MDDELFLDNSDITALAGIMNKWDGSSRNQTNDFFVGHSGYVTILWQITNNPHERYDSSKSYHMSALDGSALYVWCSLHFTYPDAFATIEGVKEQLYQMNEKGTVHHL